MHVLQKRFNEFNEIYRTLKGSHPDVASFKFPAKTLTFNKDAATLKEMRRERFNEFVVILMKIKPMPAEVRKWLESEGHKGASAFKGAASSRAFKDRPTVIPAVDEKGLIFELMMKPAPFLKFGRSGAPHWRNFSLSADRKKIIWTSSKKGGNSQILISEMKFVENSQRSKGFERQLAKRKDFTKLSAVSLSISYTPHGKAQQQTLDVMCKHPEVLRVWHLGVEMLMADYLKTSPADRRAYGAAAGAGGGGADAGAEEDDDDEGDGGGETTTITGACKAYTWGVGGWGQLGRAASGGNADDEPRAEADGRALPIAATVVKRKIKSSDARAVSCGANATAVLTRDQVRGCLVSVFSI